MSNSTRKEDLIQFQFFYFDSVIINIYAHICVSVCPVLDVKRAVEINT